MAIAVAILTLAGIAADWIAAIATTAEAVTSIASERRAEGMTATVAVAIVIKGEATARAEEVGVGVETEIEEGTEGSA